MNWKRLLCLIRQHKPVFILESPIKAMVSGSPLLITYDHPGGEVTFRGKVVCLWCGRPLKGIRVVVKVIKEDG